MPYDPSRHHRQSHRLADYDYSQPGAYFVTMNTQDRVPLFGEVIDGRMRLSPAGRVVEGVWRALPQRYPCVVLDAFVVMPDHVHALIWIVGDSPEGGGAMHDGEGALLPDGARASDGRASDGRASDGRASDGRASDGRAIHESPMHSPTRSRTQSPMHSPTRSRTQSPRRSPHPEEDDSPEARRKRRRRMLIPLVIGYLKMNAAKRINDLRGMPGARVWQRDYYERVIRSERHLYAVRRYICDNPSRWTARQEET